MDNKNLINEAEQIVEKVAGKSKGREALEWIFSIVIALVVALIIKEFIFTVVRVDGPSMLPTFEHNDRAIVWRLGYKPENDDVIILQKPGYAPFIKRVIATEGQTVDIDFNNGKVFVDGVEIDEPYINEPTRLTGDVQFPATVPEGCVFVLGDNRNNSKDSRSSSVGMVKKEEIMGKVVFRFWPLNKMKSF